MNDKINFSVGYENVMNVGNKVNPSSPLVTIHSASKNDFEKVKDKIQECFQINDKKVDKLSIIYKTIH